MQFKRGIKMVLQYGSGLLIFCSIVISLSAEPARDSLYEVRSPGNIFIEKFRSEPAFDYTEVVEENAWRARFIRWLSALLGGASAETTADILGFLFKIIAVGCVFFALYLMIKTGIIAPWGQRKKKFKRESVDTLVLSDSDRYRKLLGEALKMRDYKSAVRIHYLNVLYLLNEKELIHWDIYKTNASYIREIPSEKREAFRNLSYVFDCVCYGNFEIDEEVYRKTRHYFLDFEKEVGA
ncbi:MAG: hypothetical protein HP000_04000 [Odoribacter sp.]|nr:hypothetical protein [Odoribacter sp.]